MPNEQIREVARDAVLTRTTKRWHRIHPTGFLGKMFQPFFGSTKIEAIFVVEYDAVDQSQMICEGNRVDAWCIDHHGKRSIGVDDIDTGPVHGKIWYRQLVAFAVHADDTKVLVNEWDGPDNGRLVRYAVKSGANGIALTFRGASAIIGGYSVG